MDFRFTAEQEAFRAEVRSFIRAELPKPFTSVTVRPGVGGRSARRHFSATALRLGSSTTF